MIDRNLVQIAIGALFPLVSLGSEIFRLGTKLEKYEALSLTRHIDFLPAFIGRLQTWSSYYLEYGRWPLLLVAMLPQ